MSACINNTPIATAGTGPDPDAQIRPESSTPPPERLPVKVAVIDEFTQGRIVGYHEVGLSSKEIGQQIGRNEATVRAVIKK